MKDESEAKVGAWPELEGQIAKIPPERLRFDPKFGTRRNIEKYRQTVEQRKETGIDWAVFYWEGGDCPVCGTALVFPGIPLGRNLRWTILFLPKMRPRNGLGAW